MSNCSGMGTSSCNCLIVNLSKTWGGGEHWAYTTASLLHQNGHSVQVLSYPQSALHLKLKSSPIAYKCIKIRSLSLLNPYKWYWLITYLWFIRPKNVILNASHELLVVGLIAKLLGIPNIIYRRGIPRPLKNHFLNRWYFRHVVTRLIVNSKVTLEAFQQSFPFDWDLLRPHVLYNAIDTEHWKPSTMTDKSVVGVVGRLSHEKGQDLALEAFAKVCTELPEAKLWFIGEGDFCTELQAKAAALNISDHCWFAGHQENVQDWMKQMSVLLVPSRWEGFGFVIIEAMALGLPVIAFKGTAAEEIIDPLRTGFLVCNNDLQELTTVCKNLLNDAKFRTEIGQQARIEVEKRFSHKAFMQKLLSILG